MVRLAVGQFSPILLDADANIRRVADLLGQAEKQEVDVLVLPELANSGYAFESAKEVEEIAEHVPAGRYCRALRDWSAPGRLVVSGICERFGNNLYNSAVAFAGEEHLVTYRKIHLFNTEKEWFTPGNEEPPVFTWKDGIYGLMVCWDWAFPEVTRILALKGAHVVLHPANLVLSYCQSAMKTRSLENGIFTATSNRTGNERGLAFSGQSQITGCRGELLASLEKDDTGLVYVDIDPRSADDKMLTERNHLLQDRRPELYKRLTNGS
jgi:predicted amidohydrolase